MLKIIFRKHNTKKNTHRVCSNTWCLLINTTIYSVAHMLIKFILYGVLMPRLPCLQLLILITNKNCCNYTDHRVFFRKENTRVSANLLLIMSAWTKTFYFIYYLQTKTVLYSSYKISFCRFITAVVPVTTEKNVVFNVLSCPEYRLTIWVMPLFIAIDK